jgi:hypothetical protein
VPYTGAAATSALDPHAARARQQFVFVSAKALRSAAMLRISCIRVDAPIVRRKTFT